MLSLAKGVENTTFLWPTEILTDVLGVEQPAVLSGPSHAEEISRGMPAFVAASNDMELGGWIQHASAPIAFVYTNLDPIGVELGGALKNIIGIAAGISDGLGFGDTRQVGAMTRRVPGRDDAVRRRTGRGAADIS